MEVPFPGLGAARLQTQAGRGGHLLRSALHTVHRLGEGWGPGGPGLSPEGEMLKGPEKDCPSHGACVSSRGEDEVLSLPSAAAEDLVLSSQQCFLAEPFFTVFLESRALSPVTYKNFKPMIIVSICFSNNLPISGLKQHKFISLHFCSLDVQQGSH